MDFSSTYEVMDIMKTLNLGTQDTKVMKVTTAFSKSDGFENFEALVDLIEKNNITDILEMIDEKKLYKLVDSKGSTLVHYGAACGNVQFIEYAIARNWDIDVKNEDSKTPLMLAADYCQEDVIDILFKADMNKNSPKVSQKSFYDMFVDDKPSLRTVYEFLDKLKMKNSNEEKLARKLVQLHCPLAYVLRWQNKNILENMLEFGCFVDSKICDTNLTGLHVVSIEGNLDLIRLFHKYNANIAVESSEGRTALDYYLQQNSGNNNEASDILEILARNTDLLFKKNNYGLYPINLAMSLGSESIVRTILKMNIDLSEVDHRNESFLFHAVANRNHKIFNVLEEFKNLEEICKKLINLKNVDGNNPLHFACMIGNASAVEFFIRLEVNLSVRDGNNRTAFEIATKYNGSFFPGHHAKCINLLKLATDKSSCTNM